VYTFQGLVNNVICLEFCKSSLHKEMCNRSYHYMICSRTLWSVSEYSGRLHCG